MTRLITLLAVLMLSCNAQKQLKSPFVDNMTLTDHFTTIQIVAQSERVITSELNVIYASSERLKLHCIRNSSLEERKLDTVYVLSGEQATELESIMQSILAGQIDGDEKGLRGSLSVIELRTGELRYEAKSNDYISLHDRLVIQP